MTATPCQVDGDGLVPSNQRTLWRVNPGAIQQGEAETLGVGRDYVCVGGVERVTMCGHNVWRLVAQRCMVGLVW